MTSADMLKNIGESLGSTATVRSIFGEPIHIEGKTVIPVAKIAYGFGAGGGHGQRNHDASGEPPEGGGGGGGVRALPAGALEITPTETRFIPYPNYRPLIIAFTAGLLFGKLFLHRKH